MGPLSIIFQGAAVDNNSLCSDVIENIAITRRCYPEDEIILSTWKLSAALRKELEDSLKKLQVIIIENEDPGPLVYQEKGTCWVTNINRMIVSSRQGIERATHAEVIKLRTDSRLYNRNIAELLQGRSKEEQRYPRDPAYSLFRQRIINGNLFARNARGYMPYLFHPGDILMAGNKQDLLALFDIPLADESIFEVCFCFSIFSLMRYVPEQYLWVKYIEKMTGLIEFQGNRFSSEKLKVTSENFYINNFIPYSSEALGFLWSKYSEVYKNKGLSSVYTTADWRMLYHPLVAENDVLKLSQRAGSAWIFFLRTVLWMKFLPLHISIIRRLAIKLFSRRT